MKLSIETKNQSSIFTDDIEALDLTMVKLKLQDKEEGEGWHEEQCKEVEKEYKRFLSLKRKYPEKEIVPNGSIDKFWHQHILDTAQYAIDCQNLFGFFLHHYPYFGMNGVQDAKNLADAFEETKLLYKTHFGDDYVGFAKRCTAPKCRTQCKPVKCK